MLAAFVVIQFLSGAPFNCRVFDVAGKNYMPGYVPELFPSYYTANFQPGQFQAKCFLLAAGSTLPVWEQSN